MSVQSDNKIKTDTQLPNNDINHNKSSTNFFLANVVSLFHISIILFVLIAPFTDILSLLILHVVFCLTLLLHWVANNNICSLSVMEAKLRGLDYTESFSHKFIGPMYDISSTSWSNICYVITISLMLISIYMIYKSERLKNIMSDYQRIKDMIKNDPDNYTSMEKFNLYTLCFKNLFVI